MICVGERYVPIVVQKHNGVLNATSNIIQRASPGFSVAGPVLRYFPFTFIRLEAGFQCIYI